MKFLQRSRNSVSITNETIIRAILLTLAAFMVLRFISNVSHQLQLIFVSAFLALALNPAVTWITQRLRSRSRVRATGVAYIMVITLLFGFLALVVPPLITQTTDFIKDVPQTITDFKTQDSALARTARRYNLDKQLDKISHDFSDKVSDDFTGPVFSTAGRIGGTLLSIITVFVLTFMMLIEGPVWFKRILEMQPEEKRAHTRDLLVRMYRVVTGYVNGQVLIAAIAAGFALVALLIASSLFDASINAVALAGIIFMFGLIPLIGNTLGAVIVVIVCLFASSGLAIAMAVFFLIYQQIENATLQPYIQARSNQLTPLIVFVSALLGAGLGGILGAFVAIPLAGCIRVMLEDRFETLFPTQTTVEEKAPKER
jgi:predicted PurR-regulated permease PerM